MRTDLTTDVIKRLSLEKKPVGTDARGRLVFEANVGNKPYILWDSSQSAPPGFGVKVAGKKTYILRRKIHGKSIMPTVGNFADFPDIASARKKAQELVEKMLTSGSNPNADARRIAASEITLGRAFDDYRAHITTRAKPVKENTLKVFDRASRKFSKAGWSVRKVRDITPDEIISLFRMGTTSPTANEQNFRWASVVVRFAIDMETLAAASASRQATLVANPFSILHLMGMFRTRDQLEKIREENASRNPLGPSTTLGPFLEAAWSKKNSNDNETGVHYLILMLLFGCRSNELAACVWGELLTVEERKRTSHVCLSEKGEYGAYIFFHETKNGRNHRLPIGKMAKELLERRQEASAEEVISRGFNSAARKWVFPAKSKFSRSGHYTSSQDLLGRIRDEIGMGRLGRHDLRRSFGTMMVSLDVPEGIQKRFLNHSNSTVTDSYTTAEWSHLRKWINKIEQAILATAPNVYNSLKPASWPPLYAPPPHVCKPAKSRSGRPKKQTAEQT